ncbi:MULTISPECIES: hypothetical protein [unclassified Mesorhizobium]|uniref:hypothetical protein n=1 Tax=unclassified Mesorhizobium TaxID=325217 RepID=UPI0016794CEB|nr:MULTISPECIES: hypothetical protein [unclassified Mesorhizobium]
MQSVFERFLEQLSEGVDEVDFHNALAYVSSQLDLLAFAYLSLPPRPGGKPTLISNYPAPWTARYLVPEHRSLRRACPLRRMLVSMGPCTGC